MTWKSPLACLVKWLTVTQVTCRHAKWFNLSLLPQSQTIWLCLLIFVGTIKRNTIANVVSDPIMLVNCFYFFSFMLWHFLSPENTLSLSLAINCLNSIIRKQLRGDREKLTLHFTLKAKWVSLPLWVKCVFENLSLDVFSFWIRKLAPCFLSNIPNWKWITNWVLSA